MRLTLVTPPTETPIDLADAKRQCRITSDDEDLLVQAYLDAAVSWLDGYSGVLGRCMVTQTWRADITRLGEVIALPFPDIQITTADFSDTTAGALVYEWHESMASPALLPRGGFGRPASVVFTAGYGPASAVPEALKQAVRLLVQYYEGRGADPTVADHLMRSVHALIAPFRVQRI